MTFGEYQELAQRTANTKYKADKIENAVMGLNGEAGECIDIYKKYKFQNHPMNFDKMLDELSDVLWYCAELAEGLGTSLEHVAVYNIEKLKKRFPDGFETDKSLNRNE